ncbi:SDR family oxidoreductase [Streptomyces lavendulae]|uniref:SDR family oxidoreductase n=1 Tax=Streptomyces lavendulae TaxID=1914 RepID=UPI00367BEFC1
MPLSGYGLWEPALATRVTALPGDLEAPRLGLPEETFTHLAEVIDVVCHNGARVNHLDPYGRPRAANVEGTREVLRLAATHRVKPVHYVSSPGAAVATGDNPDVITEDRRLDPAEVSGNGYVAGPGDGRHRSGPGPGRIGGAGAGRRHRARRLRRRRHRPAVAEPRRAGPGPPPEPDRTAPRPGAGGGTAGSRVPDRGPAPGRVARPAGRRDGRGRLRWWRRAGGGDAPQRPQPGPLRGGPPVRPVQHAQRTGRFRH